MSRRAGPRALGLALAVAFTTLVGHGGEDRATLQRRAAQFEQGLQARAAELLATDEAAQDTYRRLKQRQQALQEALAAHPEVAALAALETSNVTAYRRQYVPLRLRLLREDARLRELHAEVQRHIQELARRLAADPATRELRERLAAVTAALSAAGRP